MSLRLPANDNEPGIDLINAQASLDVGMAGLARYFGIVLMLAEVHDRMSDGLLDNLAYLRARDPSDPESWRLAHAYVAARQSGRPNPEVQSLIAKSRLGAGSVGLAPMVERPARLSESKPTA